MYEDPIIKKYISLFKTAGVEIKTYYQGEPFKIPVSELPACFISKTETDVGVHNNSEDEHEVGYRITVVTDIRDELSDTKTIVAGIAKLMEIMEARDATTYKLKTNTVLHVLRNNIEVDTANNLRTNLGSSTRIDYGDSINRREQGWFVESYIDFVAHFIQIR